MASRPGTGCHDNLRKLSCQFFIGWDARRKIKRTSIVTGIALALIGLFVSWGWDGTAVQAWYNSASAWVGQSVEGVACGSPSRFHATVGNRGRGRRGSRLSQEIADRQATYFEIDFNRIHHFLTGQKPVKY
jgi:hypothetical protein